MAAILSLFVFVFVFSISIASVISFFHHSEGLKDAFAAKYFVEQTNFTESEAPLSIYKWDKKQIEGCVLKDENISNSYFAWTKLAVQKWKQALVEFTGNTNGWNMTVRMVDSQSQLESCTLRFHVIQSYIHLPEYPNQTSTYTTVKFENNIVKYADVYLPLVVLHAEEKTLINLPPYAFRNSIIHEMGHVLGLGHMHSKEGYLMSPHFDFIKNKDQLPITTLELEAITRIYGKDGFK